MMMSSFKDRILVIENDPIVSDLIGRQTLQSLGYNVQTVGDATSAIPQTLQFTPDVLIVDLNLPGLSGKDFLVALNSQGIRTPVIVIAQKGAESDVIQAFRLGATDYLLWPVREAEVVSAVERVLSQVRERRERDHLARQLQQTNQELQYRLRELTTIFAVGKAVTSVTDQRILFDKIVEGSVKVTQADLGWFLLRDDNLKAFILAAHRGLPNSLLGKQSQPWDDGISSLVAMSGESLSIFGDPLKRFKISPLGQAALISPIKVQKQVVGLLVVLRKAARSFGPSEQNLLEAVCDYASISLVNARLFRALEERARSLQVAAENADQERAPTKRPPGTATPIGTGRQGHRPLDR
jgi:two-component system NtrC family sensor kinase